MPESTEPTKPVRQPVPKWFLVLLVGLLMVSPGLVMLTLIYGLVVPVFALTFLGLGGAISAYVYLEAIGAIQTGGRRRSISDMSHLIGNSPLPQESATRLPEAKGPPWAWGMLLGGIVLFFAGVTCLSPLGIHIPLDFLKRR